MKLHILNDLHIEFEDFDPPATDADVVILAGDIGVGLEGLRWAEARFPDRPVIYVPGNHEFYHHDLALIEELKAQAPEHIHVLNDDQVVIDGVRFLGSILWTDFALYGEGERFYAMKTAEKWMTDFSIIRNAWAEIYATGCRPAAHGQPRLAGIDAGRALRRQDGGGHPPRPVLALGASPLCPRPADPGLRQQPGDDDGR